MFIQKEIIFEKNKYMSVCPIVTSVTSLNGGCGITSQKYRVEFRILLSFVKDCP